MSAKVIAFPRPIDAGNLAEALRWYADEIEAKRLTPRSAIVLFHHGEGYLPEVVGLGAPLNRLESAAILDQAHLRAQAVAFRGPHA